MNDSEKSKFPQTIEDLEKFIDCYQNKLVHHAFFKLGEKEEAEDLVQDVIIKMYRDRSKYSEIENPSSFFFKAVSNGCIDKLRARKTNQSHVDSFCQIQDGGFSTDSSMKLVEKEEYKRVSEILSQIPAEQAEVIHHRVIDEMSFVEIAKILEVPPTTVKSRFKYGINKLKSICQKMKEVHYEL
jgi:RNA polymerase sigma-70 factor, ECF subfamily